MRKMEYLMHIHILEYLKSHNDRIKPCTIGNLMEHTGYDLETIKSYLLTLKSRGHVKIKEILGAGFSQGTHCYITHSGTFLTQQNT
jgi:predicted esterase